MKPSDGSSLTIKFEVSGSIANVYDEHGNIMASANIPAEIVTSWPRGQETWGVLNATSGLTSATLLSTGREELPTGCSVLRKVQVGDLNCESCLGAFKVALHLS